MELRVLRYFLAVAREESISGAAAALHVTQPTLSQQLGVLRREGLVATRREGKFIWYQLADQRALQLMQTVHQLFCQAGEDA